MCCFSSLEFPCGPLGLGRSRTLSRYGLSFLEDGLLTSVIATRPFTRIRAHIREEGNRLASGVLIKESSCLAVELFVHSVSILRFCGEFYLTEVLVHWFC